MASNRISNRKYKYDQSDYNVVIKKYDEDEILQTAWTSDQSI